MALHTFSAKDPEEDIIVGIGFAKRLAAGETILACIFENRVHSGADPNPGAMMVGQADLAAAPMVRQRIIGGLPGVRYLLSARVVTSAGRTYVGSAVLPVEIGGA